MDRLNDNWFIEPAIDFELKTYVLSGWLQKIERELYLQHFFPTSNDLKAQVKNLERYRNQKSLLVDQVKGNLIGFQDENLQPEYEFPLNKNDLLDEVDQIVEWSLKKLRKKQLEVDDIISQYESGLTLEPIGIMPLYRKEGYLFLPLRKEISVYEYSVQPLYPDAEAMNYYVQTNVVGRYEWSAVSTYEKLKSELSKSQQKFAVPATFFCTCKYELPVEESLLPLATKKLLSYIQ